MLDVLKNIFDPGITTTIYATVSERISATRYRVVDAVGNELFVQSDSFYPVGANIRVENGRITGRGALEGYHKHYEV